MYWVLGIDAVVEHFTVSCGSWMHVSDRHLTRRARSREVRLPGGIVPFAFFAASREMSVIIRYYSPVRWTVVAISTGGGDRGGGTTHDPLTPHASRMRGDAWREVPCPGVMELNREPHWPNGGVSWKAGSMH
ncbi:protein of unknown function [Methanoculleus bourgensis]|uniref:Uncharacterized protein n=1 Tax=Methanoculleus bourgensis TaxID=83986 RepID=A0A0X3BJK2_9EURY|nr:protein of unknown function [Methanoculleus bourgensis]